MTTFTKVLTKVAEYATRTTLYGTLFDFTVTTGRLGPQVLPVIHIDAVIGEIRNDTYFPWETAFQLSKLRMELQSMSTATQENNSNDISYYEVIFTFKECFVEISEKIEIQ